MWSMTSLRAIDGETSCHSREFFSFNLPLRTYIRMLANEGWSASRKITLLSLLVATTTSLARQEEYSAEYKSF